MRSRPALSCSMLVLEGGCRDRGARWYGCAVGLVVGLAASVLPACVSSTGERAATAQECRSPTEQASGGDTSAPADTALQLISISPPTGSDVQRSTVLVADLAYTVKDFAAGRFIILAQFDLKAERRTTDGAIKSHPYLESASGSYRLCFPLTDIWDRDVKRPLSVRFVLDRVDASHRHHPVAKTEKLSYQTE